jgi:hypothetical protein
MRRLPGTNYAPTRPVPAARVQPATAGVAAVPEDKTRSAELALRQSSADGLGATAGLSRSAGSTVGRAKRGARLGTVVGPLVSAGCCLLVACCGCIYPALRQQGMVRDGRPLKLGQGSWAERQARGEHEGSGREEGSAPGPEGEPGRKAGHPDLEVPEVPSSEEPGNKGSCSKVDCTGPAPLGHGLGGRILGACASLGRPLRARIETSRYRYPRFHPVPLRPVFLPRVGEALAEDGGGMPEGGHVLAPPPVEGSPQIDTLLPRLGPGEVPRPKAASGEEDRATRLQRDLQTVSRPGNWLLNLPEVRKPAR